MKPESALTPATPPRFNPTASARACRRLLEQAGLGPVVFAGVDAYYALGPENWLPSYAVACLHDSGVLPLLEARGVTVFCLERHLRSLEAGRESGAGQASPPNTVPQAAGTSQPGEEVGRDTHALLAHPATQSWLEEHIRPQGTPELLLFKPSAQIENLAARHDWRILGAPARLARPLENKVRFYELLDELNLPHPPWKEVDLSTVTRSELVAELGESLIIQGAHGFSGKSSHRIDNDDDFALAARELGGRSARAAGVIPGYPATLNACVMSDGVVRIGRLFHQVTGAPECTTFPLGACGNDWSTQPIPEAAQWLAATITRTLGRHLYAQGYRGVLGLDFIVTPINSVLTIEINPRLVSSIQLITRLEEACSRVPLLVYHLLATHGSAGKHIPKVVHGNIEHDYPRLSGAQLVLHNLSGQEVRVGGQLTTGIYRLCEGQLRFLRSSYSLEECAAPTDDPEHDEFLVLPAPAGRLLQPGGECARIQVAHPLLELEPAPCFVPGRLSERARHLATQVYQALALTPLPERGEGGAFRASGEFHGGPALG